MFDKVKIKEYIIFPGDARNNSVNAKQFFDIIVFSGNFVLLFPILLFYLSIFCRIQKEVGKYVNHLIRVQSSISILKLKQTFVFHINIIFQTQSYDQKRSQNTPVLLPVQSIAFEIPAKYQCHKFLPHEVTE